MPTYEFRCPLGHEFEKFYRSIGTSEAQAACPDCGKLAERMMSAGAGLVFKGSGFYLTDYGKNAHQNKGTEAKADGAKSDGQSGEVGKESGKEGTKSDSAPASGGDAPKSGGSESPKSESAPKSDTKASDSKPASTTPKPSSSE